MWLIGLFREGNLKWPKRYFFIRRVLSLIPLGILDTSRQSTGVQLNSNLKIIVIISLIC